MSMIDVPVSELSLNDASTHPPIDKKTLLLVHTYFGNNLEIARCYNANLGKYTTHYKPFVCKIITNHWSVIILQKIEKIFLRIINNIENNYFLKVNDFNRITINDFINIFNIDKIHKPEFIKFLDSINVLDMHTDYIISQLYICTWPNLLTIINNIDTVNTIINANDNEKKFIHFCYTQFDKILKQVIYRIKESIRSSDIFIHKDHGY